MRNNIKKIFNCFLMIAILSVSICNTITYAKAESYTYSIGTNYGGIDTSDDATYSATVFSMAGYKSYYSTAPTVSYMLGNSPSGKPRLESNIIFLSGHGNHDHMHFNYLQSGGNYATGIIQGNHRVSETLGYEYAGINDYNMNNVELAILAGCQTASGNDNITNDVVNHKLIFNKEKFDETVFENEIEKIIEDREGININDYKMITNEMGNTKVIDYIELVGGVETNRGLTAIIENGIVEKIYMNNSKVCLYDNMVEKPKLNEKKVMNDIYRKVSERYKVIKQDSKWIYDVNENKFKYIIFTDYIADKLGGLGRNEVCIEVD